MKTYYVNIPKIVTYAGLGTTLNESHHSLGHPQLEGRITKSFTSKDPLHFTLLQ